MKQFLNGNMPIVVGRVVEFWPKIWQFCKFCKFTNRNTRILFTYQCLEIECSTLLQKIQLYLLHRTPIDLSTLVPWRSLLLILYFSPNWYMAYIKLTPKIDHKIPRNMYIYINSEPKHAKSRHETNSTTYIRTIWSEESSSYPWESMGNIPNHLSLKRVFVFLLVKLQNCEFLAIFQPPYQPLQTYQCLKKRLFGILHNIY